MPLGGHCACFVQTFRPMVKTSTGGSLAIPFETPFSQWSNHLSLVVLRSTRDDSPKSTPPSFQVVFTWCGQGPIISFWLLLVLLDLRGDVMPRKLAWVPITSSSYHPEMWRTGTLI